MIGKDAILQDTRDPLGGSNKMSSEFKLLYEKFKLYLESKCDYDGLIIETSSKAIQSYKDKAR